MYAVEAYRFLSSLSSVDAVACNYLSSRSLIVHKSVDDYRNLSDKLAREYDGVVASIQRVEGLNSAVCRELSGLEKKVSGVVYKLFSSGKTKFDASVRIAKLRSSRDSFSRDLASLRYRESICSVARDEMRFKYVKCSVGFVALTDSGTSALSVLSDWLGRVDGSLDYDEWVRRVDASRTPAAPPASSNKSLAELQRKIDEMNEDFASSDNRNPIKKALDDYFRI